MKLVAAKCPSCGADIEVDQNSDRTVCDFCNSKIIVEDAIHKYKVEISGEVQIDNSKQMDALLKNANRLFGNEEYAEAFEKYDRVLDIDPNQSEALIKSKLCKVFSKHILVSNSSDFKKVLLDINSSKLDNEELSNYYGLFFEIVKKAVKNLQEFPRPLKAEQITIDDILNEYSLILERLFDETTLSYVKRNCANIITSISIYLKSKKKLIDCMFSYKSKYADEASKKYDKYVSFS